MSKHSASMKVGEYFAWLIIAIIICSLFFGLVANELFAAPETEFHNATLVRDDIGNALTCWSRDGGETIFCQEVGTP